MNLKYTIDQLYKEVAKKENRNVSLLKEVQAVRGDYANLQVGIRIFISSFIAFVKCCVYYLQREFKMTKSMFEKINAEKHLLATDVSKSRDYINKLETCLERLENPQKMIDQVGELQMQLESTCIELEQSYVTLKDREDRIRMLDDDIEVLKRTLEVKIDFEGKTSLGIGREAMRSLYFELGKRQADSHGLSVSLAQCNRALSVSNSSLEKIQSE